MTESAIKNASMALYQYLCLSITGIEEHIKTTRMMNAVRDHIEGNKERTTITSGSFGEGLEMRGSDLDIMDVMKSIEVCEDANILPHADKTFFTMEMEDTHPGYAKLRLVHSTYQVIAILCIRIGSDFYFSNNLFKRRFTSNILSTVHGPCLSDKYGLYDIAYCLHCKLWITQAEQWITRSNNSWPTHDVKQAIVKHGVLFVPIGVKGSTKEELEWRISFSVGEKLLLHSFSHTQLLCYALMKIILKDIIDVDIDCKELLCSYFMKTILFWICEELPLSIWKPENFIFCFMRCFNRLLYCVKYSVCPHYFIPENNLFESKIQGKAHEALLNKLYILNSYGWQFILLSDQISNFHLAVFDITKETSFLHLNRVNRSLTSVMTVVDTQPRSFVFLWEKMIYHVLYSTSVKIKSIYIYYMSKYIHKSHRLLPFDDLHDNKSKYKQYTTNISTLLLSTRHDAVSGWLLLASFFYRRKQYNTALYIIKYSLIKCSPEKLHKHMHVSYIHYELFHLHLFRNMTVVQLWKYLLLNVVVLPKNSILIPSELHIEDQYSVPPVVYAHFLGFLCHYHLKNIRHHQDSLRALQLTIEENYVIANHWLKAFSYNIQGISFQLLGDIESARQALMQSIELYPSKEDNVAYQILSLISECD